VPDLIVEPNRQVAISRLIKWRPWFEGRFFLDLLDHLNLSSSAGDEPRRSAVAFPRSMIQRIDKKIFSSFEERSLAT